MNNQANAPKVLKESRRKITVDFERTSLKERMKLKYLSVSYIAGLAWRIFRFLLLVGVSYVILYPFFSKITSSFMSAEDFKDVTVKLIPKYPTLNTYKAIMFDLANETSYFECLFNTVWLSLGSAILQTFICCVIGYGFAKFKFKGSGVLFGLVLFTMIVPHGTIQVALQSHFQEFDLFGIYKVLSGGLTESFAPLASLEGFGSGEGLFGNENNTINLKGTPIPMLLLSLGGIGFKNGLYIYMMRQFFKGIPDELEESAYLDGYGIFKTFIFIVIPLSVPMMITIFLFAFSWQWTDEFYTGMFFESGGELKFLPDIITAAIEPNSQYVNLNDAEAAKTIFESAITNTKGLIIILPLLIVYLFCQRYLVEGIERSGLVG